MLLQKVVMKLLCAAAGCSEPRCLRSRWRGEPCFNEQCFVDFWICCKVLALLGSFKSMNKHAYQPTTHSSTRRHDTSGNHECRSLTVLCYQTPFLIGSFQQVPSLSPNPTRTLRHTLLPDTCQASPRNPCEARTLRQTVLPTMGLP